MAPRPRLHALALVAAASPAVVDAALASAPIDLADVAVGDGGFVIAGSTAGEHAGVSVASAGDVNGDGIPDVVVGVPFADPGGAANAGTCSVVFGKADGAPVSLFDIFTGIGGFFIAGVDAGDQAGSSVAGAGDVNGDGLDDVVIGALFGDPSGVQDAGESYVVFGKASTASVSLALVAAGFGGFVMNGIDVEDHAGWSVSGAGDVNGDGLSDVIVGAPSAEPGPPPPVGNPALGESYVVFGKAGTAPVALSAIAAGAGGFMITGDDANDAAGSSVGGAGDVNGDGLDDVIVGAPGGDPSGVNLAGESYVVFGKATTTGVDLHDVALGAGGFVMNGYGANSQTGHAVAGAGDVNGDGPDDLVIGGPNQGRVHVVFGKASGSAVSLSAVASGAGGGFAVIGVGGLFGFTVSGAGDVDGDGRDDVIAGARNLGDSYVVFGKATPAAVSLADVVSGAGGFVIAGPSDVYGVSGAGDMDADGFADVVVGHPFEDSAAGAAFLVFSPFPFAPSDVDQDGTVGFSDLLIVLAEWGTCPPECPPCAGDVNGDCAVGFADLLLVLANWS